MSVGDNNLPRVADFFAGSKTSGGKARRSSDTDWEEVFTDVLQLLIVISPGELVVLGELVINSYSVIVDDLSVLTEREVVVIAATRARNIGGRKRIQIQNILRDRIDEGRRNPIVRKTLVGSGGQNTAANRECGEISVSVAHTRDNCCKRELEIV